MKTGSDAFLSAFERSRRLRNGPRGLALGPRRRPEGTRGHSAFALGLLGFSGVRSDRVGRHAYRTVWPSSPQGRRSGTLAFTASHPRTTGDI